MHRVDRRVSFSRKSFRIRSVENAKTARTIGESFWTGIVESLKFHTVGFISGVPRGMADVWTCIIPLSTSNGNGHSGNVKSHISIYGRKLITFRDSFSAVSRQLAGSRPSSLKSDGLR